MFSIRKAAAAVSIAALSLVGLSALPASATTPDPVSTVADPDTKAQWVYETFVLNNKLYYYATDPATDRNKLMFLDGTKSTFVDLTAIPNFDSVNDIMGAYNNYLYIVIYDTNGTSRVYAFNGTTFTEIPDFANDDWDFESGFAYNGAWYFRGTSSCDACDYRYNDILFKVSGATGGPVFTGDANNHQYFSGAEPVGSFNGKLYMNSSDVNGNSRMLHSWDGTNYVKVTTTMDLGGTPTLRNMPHVFSGHVMGDYFYFGSNYEAYDENDTSWNGGADRALFRMDKSGNIIRLDASVNPGALTGTPEYFFEMNGSLYFWVSQNGSQMTSLYKVAGTAIEFVALVKSPDQWGVTVYKNKAYFYSHGTDANADTPGLTVFDGTNFSTLFTATQGYWNGIVAAVVNDVLIMRAPSSPAQSPYDVVKMFDGTAFWDVGGLNYPDISYARVFNGDLYLPAASMADSTHIVNLYKITAGNKSVTPPTTPNPEDPNVTTVTETKTVKAISGPVTFPDGSGFDVDSKGRVYAKVNSIFLTSSSGTLTASYKVGSATKSYTCKIKAFGSTKKLKKALTKKVLSKTKTPCQLPAAALSAMKSKSITLKLTLVVKRYLSNTGLAKTSAGKVIKPLTRKMTVTMGKVVTP